MGREIERKFLVVGDAWRALASPQTLAAGGTGQSHAAGSMGILVA